MECWIRAKDNSGNLSGINDSSIYTFRSRKYESLAREILQNSLDELHLMDKPVRVEFHTFEIKTAEIPGIDCFRELFSDGLEYWKDDKQDNGREFFGEALRILKQESVPIMRISDFNTKGVLGSTHRDVRSSADITPWYNLLKSEGSSSKGNTQGGSFGIGKNAAFANSALRTVFYSTYDIEGIEGYEGVAKLATVYKSGKQFSAKAFYGKEVGGNSHAISRLLDLDPEFERTDWGTDLYIIGFEQDNDWEMRMKTSILSDFMVPIHERMLEVDLNGEGIDAGNIEETYKSLISHCDENKMTQLKNELVSSYNYYKVLTSEETIVFKKDFPGKGSAVLKVLYDPDFERKIMRTRKTGMKLFDRGGVSSSIGFSGIVNLEGEKLNKLFRKMENPAHTSWSSDTISDVEEKKDGERILKELNRWMRNEVINNAADQETEAIDVSGLSDYLPAELVDKEQGDNDVQEYISSRIADITSNKEDRKGLNREKRITKDDPATGDFDENGEPGGTYKPGGKDSEEGGGKGKKKDDPIAGGDREVFKKIKKNKYKSRLMKHEEDYLLLISSEQEIEQAMVKIFISGETALNFTKIEFARDANNSRNYKLGYKGILLERIGKGEKVAVLFGLEDGNDYALEVDLYEYQQQ